ncbi:MAG: DUF4832 domain-containing protein [Planctomycetota bacterium]
MLLRYTLTWLVGLLPVMAVSWSAYSQATQTFTYAGTDEIFANPERGFMFTNRPGADPDDFSFFLANDTRPLSLVDFDDLRAQHITVVEPVYLIDDFRDAPLSPDFLAQVQSEFDLVRAEGMKLAPRFIYNFNQDFGSDDASESRTLEHLGQLAPVFGANRDVLAFTSLGFIGKFGEWQASTNGHIPDGRVVLTGSGINIAQGLLDAVPEERMVTFRYPDQGSQLIGDYVGLDRNEAYTQTARARLGMADHALAFNDNESQGTWDLDASERAFDQAFIEAQSEYTIHVGEPFSNSEFARTQTVAYAERFHLSNLSSTQGDAERSGLYDDWRDSGVYDELDRRLGYRYRLIEATLPTITADAISVGLRLANDGVARLYNPRDLELVLRDPVTGESFRLAYEGSVDERLLLPGGGEVADLQLDFDPNGIDPGVYELLLNLPDPEPTLNLDPRYSIRLANDGFWEPDTGFNRLNAQVVLVPEPACLATTFVLAGMSRRFRRVR